MTTKTIVDLSTGDTSVVPLDATDLATIAAMQAASAPLTCDAFQIRAALTQQNLRTQVEAAVAASTNQTLKDAWAFSQVFTENDQFVLQMAAALGQTAAQTHALFQLAGTLAP